MIYPWSSYFTRPYTHIEKNVFKDSLAHHNKNGQKKEEQCIKRLKEEMSRPAIGDECLSQAVIFQWIKCLSNSHHYPLMKRSLRWKKKKSIWLPINYPWNCWWAQNFFWTLSDNFYWLWGNNYWFLPSSKRAFTHFFSTKKDPLYSPNLGLYEFFHPRNQNEVEREEIWWHSNNIVKVELSSRTVKISSTASENGRDFGKSIS